MLFAGNHYQPLVPNEFYASEFQLMRPTLNTMAGYPFSPQRNQEKQSSRLAVRSNGLLGNALQVEKGPPPTNWPLSGLAIRSVMTGGLGQDEASQAGTTHMDLS